MTWNRKFFQTLKDLWDNLSFYNFSEGTQKLKTESQGGQVGYAPDFHPGGPGTTLTWGNSQTVKRIIRSLPLMNEFRKTDLKIYKKKSIPILHKMVSFMYSNLSFIWLVGMMVLKRRTLNLCLTSKTFYGNLHLSKLILRSSSFFNFKHMIFFLISVP